MPAGQFVKRARKKNFHAIGLHIAASGKFITKAAGFLLFVKNFTAWNVQCKMQYN